MIQTNSDEMIIDIHEYLHGVKSGSVPLFNEEYERFQEKYKLPV